MIGARLASVGALALALAACAAPTARPPTPSPKPPAPTAPTAEAATAVPVAPPMVANPPDSSPWSVLRESFAMQACDYRPAVQRWARTYSRSVRQFEASWKRAMPFLLIVLDELQRRRLPGEFAMLPYVESLYRPIASRGDRAAGMWQLMPDTAREAGLVVDAGYDARLDARASTSAALDLITAYYREFGDWRLADMAFNSGEFRVRKLLGERDAHTLSADELARLPFNPVTHDHLDRLLALACIVDDPQRFGIRLPEPGTRDHLQVVTLQTGMDLRVAAHLAGLDVDDVKRWNAGYRRNRMEDGRPPQLLLPAPDIERFQAALATVPVDLWNDWREQRAARSSGIASWAAQAGIPVAALAAANAVAVETTVAPTTILLLPGRDAEEAVPTARDEPSRIHVVAAGDTLSRIAHHYSIPLDRLRRMNPLAGGTLHPGQRLRVAPAAEP